MHSRMKIPGLILTMMVLLTACAPKGPPLVKTLPLEYVPSPVQMPALPPVQVDCPQATVGQGGSTTLTWMVPDSLVGLDEVVGAFEMANPGIHVELLPVNESQYDTLSSNALQAGCTAPDVLLVRVEDSAYYAAYGWLASLWNQYTFDEKEDWIQALRKDGRYAREQYTAPFDTATSLLFYNRDLFQKVGVTPPAEDERWTWEKVAETARKLTNSDVWGLAWENNTARDLVVLPESLGGQGIGLDGVTVKGVVDTKPWLEAFTFYSRLFNDWKVSPKEEPFSAKSAFQDGKLAMMVGDAKNINLFKDAPFSWGVSRHPYFRKGVVVIPTGNWQIGVNSKTQKYDAAMTLVHSLTYKVGGEVLWRSGSVLLPAEKTVLALFTSEPSLNVAPNSFWKTAAQEALVFTLPVPVTPFYPEYDLQIQKAFQDLRTGTDPQRVLSDLTNALSDMSK